SGNNGKLMSQRTLLIGAGSTATWTGGGHIAGCNGSTLTISGTFDFQTDADIVTNFGNGAAINVNSGGIFRKSSGSASTDINSPRSEERRVGKECRLQSGTLSVNGGSRVGGSGGR